MVCGVGEEGQSSPRERIGEMTPNELVLLLFEKFESDFYRQVGLDMFQGIRGVEAKMLFRGRVQARPSLRLLRCTQAPTAGCSAWQLSLAVRHFLERGGAANGRSNRRCFLPSTTDPVDHGGDIIPHSPGFPFPQHVQQSPEGRCFAEDPCAHFSEDSRRSCVPLPRSSRWYRLTSLCP
jgi:hypothetical protein